jgi:hypothetical protein
LSASEGEIGAMNAARENVCPTSVARPQAALEKHSPRLLGFVLAAALALPASMAFAQDSGGGGNPIMPKFSIGGEQKRPLTPEEAGRQKQIDADYKAATSKIPAQRKADPWGDVRQAPAGSGQKTSSSTQNASAQKKKPAAQQAQ